MKEYHKINSIFKRDEKGKFIIGEWSKPEFEYLQHNTWLFEEKIDGTNIRVMWDGERVTFGGKTDNAQLPAKLVTKLAIMFADVDRLKEIFTEPICLYGEGYGAGIQKIGGNYSKEQDFILFDIKVGNWWLKRGTVYEIGNALGLRCVPVISSGSLNDAINLVKEGFTSTWGDFMAEGLVLRPQVDLQTRNGERLITKVKHKDFS